MQVRDFGSVEAENRIDNGVAAVRGDYLMSDAFCFRQAGFLHGDVNVVIHVAVACCKMTFDRSETQIFFLRCKF